MKNRNDRFARIARIIFLMEQTGAPRLSLLTAPRRAAQRHFTFIKPQVLKPIILGR